MIKKKRELFNFLRSSSVLHGKKGEGLATKYLLKLGYLMIERNWKTRRGEVDLIVKKDKTYFFVEVKLRKSKVYGRGEEAIHPLKQKKMVQAALAYIQKNNIFSDIRFAALIIEEKNEKHVFDFFEFPLDLPNRYY